jgi:hypothetical protein
VEEAMTLDDYLAFLKTPNEAFGGMPVCPFLKAGWEKHVVLIRANGTWQELRERARDWNEGLEMAVALHPEDPFQVDGVYTRRAPYPMMQYTNLAFGQKMRMELMQKHPEYYAKWTEANHEEGFPGLEWLP